jgi:hypothetical protein
VPDLWGGRAAVMVIRAFGWYSPPTPFLVGDPHQRGREGLLGELPQIRETMRQRHRTTVAYNAVLDVEDCGKRLNVGNRVDCGEGWYGS